MISGIYDPQSVQYEEFSNRSKYDRDEGLLVLPLAMAPPDITDPTDTLFVPTFKVVRVHAPIGFRRVEWDAHKYAAPPLMPAAVETPSGDVPLGSEVGVVMPALGSGQGDYVFRAAGRYTYVQPSPRGPDNVAPLNTGWHPFNVPLIVIQLVGLLAGGLAIGPLSSMTARATAEGDQEKGAESAFTAHQNDLDFRYYSPNYPATLFSSDLIR